jgi:hypothetical protein
MSVREIKSEEEIKAESLELNPVPGSCEADNLKQISKQNSYLQNKVYIYFWMMSSGFLKNLLYRRLDVPGGF